MKKAVVLGIDGVPFELLIDMVERGVMEGLGQILQSGYTLRPMEASLPDISSVSWTSFLTGENPGVHGVFGFTDLQPNSYRLSFPNSHSIKAPPFWDTLHRERRLGRSIILNIPNTYPALPLTGILVSGFVAVDFAKAVYPPSYIPLLKGMKYVIDVDLQKATSDREGFYADLLESLAVRESAALHLFNSEEWDLFILCVTETDRLHHFFYETERSARFDEFYGRLDKLISRIHRTCQERFGEDFLFLLLSDHGFTELKEEVNLNAYLREEGILVIDPSKEYYDKVARGTLAFAMDPGRIYLHHKSRFPLGEITPEQVADVRKKVTEALFKLTSKDGQPIVRRIFEKETIYRGAYAQDGPDIVCLPFDGYDLKGNMRKDEIFSRGVFRGMHTRDNAVLVLPTAFEAPEQLNIEHPARFIRDYYTE